MSSSVVQSIVAKSVAVDSLFVKDKPIGDNTAIVREVAASGSTTFIKSGAIALPANALITTLSIVVTTALVKGNGKLGTKVGTEDAGGQICGADADSIVSSDATSTAQGVGSSTDSVRQAALSGAAVMGFEAASPFSAAARSIHMQVDNSSGNITSGACQFIVEFIVLK